MNYLIETSNSTDGVNYPSVSIYFKGCDKPEKCKGCHNSQLWKFGKEKDNIGDMIKNIEKEYLKVSKFYSKIAICFLGGEPLAKEHIKSVLEISKYFKEKYKSILTIIYSWRTHTQVIEEGKHIYLDYIDYCKYGEYIEDMKDDNFLATSNQYFYNNKTNKKIKREEVI